MAVSFDDSYLYSRWAAPLTRNRFW